MEKKLPNILWYCTDQQRSDTINKLGNKYINTPNLNKFIENGIVFKNTYVQSPICTPSRSSFLTGRYPATTHAHRNGAENFPDHEVLVTKILKDNGYDCALIGKLHLASAEGGVEKRTDDYEEIAIKRFKTYEKSTEPVIEYYKKINLLKVIDGERSIEQINKEISDIIDLI